MELIVSFTLEQIKMYLDDENFFIRKVVCSAGLYVFTAHFLEHILVTQEKRCVSFSCVTTKSDHLHATV